MFCSYELDEIALSSNLEKVASVAYVPNGSGRLVVVGQVRVVSGVPPSQEWLPGGAAWCTRVCGRSLLFWLSKGTTKSERGSLNVHAFLLFCSR